MMVYCVICMEGDSEVVHIFSTQEKANEFFRLRSEEPCAVRLSNRPSRTDGAAGAAVISEEGT
jgi:hypothetical protein